MTDTKKLKQAIADSGLKLDHIAKEMGVSRVSLYNYINCRADFRLSHIESLSRILGLDPAQKLAIFFAPDGGLKPPNQ